MGCSRNEQKNEEFVNTIMSQSQLVQNYHSLEAAPPENLDENVFFATENVQDNLINMFNENDNIPNQQIESDIPTNYIESVEYVDADQIHPETLAYTENLENTEIIPAEENIGEFSANIYTEEELNAADEPVTYEVAEFHDTGQQFFEQGDWLFLSIQN